MTTNIDRELTLFPCILDDEPLRCLGVMTSDIQFPIVPLERDEPLHISTWNTSNQRSHDQDSIPKTSIHELHPPQYYSYGGDHQFFLTLGDLTSKPKDLWRQLWQRFLAYSLQHDATYQPFRSTSDLNEMAGLVDPSYAAFTFQISDMSDLARPVSALWTMWQMQNEDQDHTQLMITCTRQSGDHRQFMKLLGNWRNLIQPLGWKEKHVNDTPRCQETPSLPLMDIDPNDTVDPQVGTWQEWQCFLRGSSSQSVDQARDFWSELLKLHQQQSIESRQADAAVWFEHWAQLPWDAWFELIHLDVQLLAQVLFYLTQQFKFWSALTNNHDQFKCIFDRIRIEVHHHNSHQPINRRAQIWLMIARRHLQSIQLN